LKSSNATSLEDSILCLARDDRIELRTTATTGCFYWNVSARSPSGIMALMGGGVTLDYSSMISAYFNPTNLSNPDPNPAVPPLPQLLFTDPEVISRIKSDLGHVLKVSLPHPSTNWQGVADLIVKRYSARLQFMAGDLLQDVFRSEINMLLDLYIDYGFSKPQDPIEVCSSHYLQPIQASIQQDVLLYSAFKAVTRRICDALRG
jgi:hypothetical protein